MKPVYLSCFQHILHSAVFEFDPSPGEREASVQSRPCFCGFSVRVLQHFAQCSQLFSTTMAGRKRMPPFLKHRCVESLAAGLSIFHDNNKHETALHRKFMGLTTSNSRKNDGYLFYE